MNANQSVRQDLVDRGLYVPEDRGPGPRPRRNPRLYSGGDVPDDNVIAIGFDIRGDYTDDRSRWACKRVQTIRGVRFYVLRGTTGADAGRLLNPVGLYFNPDDVAKVSNQRGRGRFEFKQVPEAAFADYLRFLQTKIESYLRNAERMVLDA